MFAFRELLYREKEINWIVSIGLPHDIRNSSGYSLDSVVAPKNGPTCKKFESRFNVPTVIGVLPAKESVESDKDPDILA